MRFKKDPNKNKDPKDEKGKKEDKDKFDLITIIESVEMEIPERKPPVNSIFYDYIPESQQKVTANRDDHVSKREMHDH